MPEPSVPLPTPKPRIPGVDAARAIAVAAMVFGHTADGLLAEAARALPYVQTYWKFRGLTAPLFLFVAGWAVVASFGRTDLSGWALVRARLPRVGLLLLLGYLLRWPGWNVKGLFALEDFPVRHFLGMDALQCIALSLLFGALSIAWLPGFWQRAGVLLGVALAVPLLSGPLVAAAQAANLPTLLRSALVADAQSPFPLLPWLAYFFAGAALGHLVTRVRHQAVRAAAFFVSGAAIAWGAWQLGLSNLPQTSPVLFAWRLGQVLIIAAFAMALPMLVARRLTALGRSTLVVYVFHLPVVYGWSTFPGLNARWGRALSLVEVALLALTLLAAGVALAEGIRYLKPRIARLRAAIVAARAPGAASSAGQ